MLIIALLLSRSARDFTFLPFSLFSKLFASNAQLTTPALATYFKRPSHKSTLLFVVTKRLPGQRDLSEFDA